MLLVSDLQALLPTNTSSDDAALVATALCIMRRAVRIDLSNGQVLLRREIVVVVVIVVVETAARLSIAVADASWQRYVGCSLAFLSLC